MLAAVFLQQPLGQLCAYGAGLTALRAFEISSPVTKIEIDKLWRYVVGIGAFPTLLALGFRLFMPESGRYTYEVRRNAAPREDSTAVRPSNASTSSGEDPGSSEEAQAQFDFNGLWRFLYHEGHWTGLFGCSMCWLLLDFAFYGLGFNNPSTLAKLWTTQDLTYSADPPYWLETSGIVNDTIAGVEIVNGTANGAIAEALIGRVLERNMLRAIYTVSIASILGSLLVIVLINRFDRKHMLTITFGLLAIVLFAACGSFKALFHQESLHIVLIMFWVVISFLFSFGPNTLTFVIPAEIFPTKYRCTLYGASAAFGKIGAILVQIVISQVPSIGRPNSSDIRWLLLSFAVCMLLGAFCSHYFVPQVQRRAIYADMTLDQNTHHHRSAPHYVNIPLQELPVRRRGKTSDVDVVELGYRNPS
uniref:Major facilitator superfamily (MFS) profile domain-containing protein n=1 Tax=Ramularia collo-cygni TaxID=112498 RepID=A0A2D3VGD6_9PEZI